MMTLVFKETLQNTDGFRIRIYNTIIIILYMLKN